MLLIEMYFSFADVQNLKGTLSGLRQFLAIYFSCFDESLLKMMRIVFVSPWNFSSFSRYLNFYTDFLVIYETVWLERQG